MLEILEHIGKDIEELNFPAVFVLVYAPAVLAANYYLKDPLVAEKILNGTDLEWLGRLIADPLPNNLPALGYWVFLVTITYFVLPAAFIKFVLKRRLRDFGLAFSIEKGFWKLFAAIMLLMLPLTYLMSTTAGFSAKYPFLKINDGSPYVGTTLLIWELIYFIQFFGLEFFFRGFLVHSLKPALGMYSVFAMTVPYCMIHFGKPPAETFAAIAAGIFLGWISYKNGSIWLGLLLHCSVAVSMDILALYGKGLIF
jgi:membrane protease YdiL (CAAX protease family)